MRSLLLLLILFGVVPARATDNIVHDDGTGAQISFYLPTHGIQDDEYVQYTTFRIVVAKEEKLVLFTDLSGAKTEDGEIFFGRIIIPSELVGSAEILMLGGTRRSTRGFSKKIKVSTFSRVIRAKSWTDQE